jgi:uncharacterized protein YndB with AHSA1/START domain
VKKLIPDELISFEWENSGGGYNTRVEMKFEKTGTDETLVKISEGGWKENEDDLKNSYGNCMGWSQMLSALKAFLEYGINLRKGAYGGLYKPEDFEGSKSADA